MNTRYLALALLPVFYTNAAAQQDICWKQTDPYFVDSTLFVRSKDIVTKNGEKQEINSRRKSVILFKVTPLDDKQQVKVDVLFSSESDETNGKKSDSQDLHTDLQFILTRTSAGKIKKVEVVAKSLDSKLLAVGEQMDNEKKAHFIKVLNETIKDKLDPFFISTPVGKEKKWSDVWESKSGFTHFDYKRNIELDYIGDIIFDGRQVAAINVTSKDLNIIENKEITSKLKIEYTKTSEPKEKYGSTVFWDKALGKPMRVDVLHSHSGSRTMKSKEKTVETNESVERMFVLRYFQNDPR